MATTTNRTLPAKDRAIAAALFVGDGREVEYRIEGNPGLVLAVMRPKADERVTRVWRVYYSTKIDGKRTIRKVRLGAYPKVGLAEARRRAAEIAEAVEHGRDVVQEKRDTQRQDEQAKLTFTDLVDEYLADQRSAAVKTVDEVERSLRRDALPELGHIAPSLVRDIDIERAVDAVAGRGSKSAARHLLVYLRGVFNHALIYTPRLRDKYGIAFNPASTVGRAPRGREGRYGKARPKDRALDDTEIVALWHVLDDMKVDDTTRTLIRLLLLTGQRLGEVRGARIEELLLAGDEPAWRLPRERTKNGEAHTVPLTPAMVALFVAAVGKRRRGAAFRSAEAAEGEYGKFTVQKAISRLFEKRADGTTPLTCPRFSAHDLRRTVGSGLSRLGVEDTVISRVLNHKKTDVTNAHYIRHTFEQEKRTALQKWTDHVMKLISETPQNSGV